MAEEHLIIGFICVVIAAIISHTVSDVVKTLNNNNNPASLSMPSGTVTTNNGAIYYTPRENVIPPPISAELDRLLRESAYVYRAETLTRYGDFVDAVRGDMRPRYQFWLLMNAVREMDASGFGRMPFDTSAIRLYLAFPIANNPARIIDKDLHRRACEQFLRESGKTFAELQAIYYE